MRALNIRDLAAAFSLVMSLSKLKPFYSQGFSQVPRPVGCFFKSVAF